MEGGLGEGALLCGPHSSTHSLNRYLGPPSPHKQVLRLAVGDTVVNKRLAHCPQGHRGHQPSQRAGRLPLCLLLSPRLSAACTHPSACPSVHFCCADPIWKQVISCGVWAPSIHPSRAQCPGELGSCFQADTPLLLVGVGWGGPVNPSVQVTEKVSNSGARDLGLVQRNYNRKNPAGSAWLLHALCSPTSPSTSVYTPTPTLGPGPCLGHQRD